MHRFLLFTLALPLFLANQLWAVTYESQTDHPTVIELYTSQGCSSCPPAERWLGIFTDNDALWKTYFPIAWHVDYWDAVGWPDRYASPRYSQRQWLYLKQTPLTSVYTPGVLINGRAWRGWVAGREPPKNVGQGVGKLRVTVEGESFRAQLAPTEAEPGKSYVLHMAVLGFGLTTEIKRGENAGKTLQQEFVVLADKQYTRGVTEWSGKLPIIPKFAEDAEKLGMVFWLQKPNSPVPIQAAGGWYEMPKAEEVAAAAGEQPAPAQPVATDPAKP